MFMTMTSFPSFAIENEDARETSKTTLTTEEKEAIFSSLPKLTDRELEARRALAYLNWATGKRAGLAPEVIDFIEEDLTRINDEILRRDLSKANKDKEASQKQFRQIEALDTFSYWDRKKIASIAQKNPAKKSIISHSEMYHSYIYKNQFENAFLSLPELYMQELNDLEKLEKKLRSNKIDNNSLLQLTHYLPETDEVKKEIMTTQERKFLKDLKEFKKNILLIQIGGALFGLMPLMTIPEHGYISYAMIASATFVGLYSLVARLVGKTMLQKKKAFEEYRDSLISRFYTDEKFRGNLIRIISKQKNERRSQLQKSCKTVLIK